MKVTKEIHELLEKYKSVKIDLGCGEAKQLGWIGIDIRPVKGVDLVWDLEKMPYPLPPECANLLMASHLVEHLKPWFFIDIMNEWWRILKYEGQLMIATPYGGSPGFWQDPTHINGCNETTWDYFDPFGQGLYKIYKPKPWKIEKSLWNMQGNIEVVLAKRREDKSYYL